VDPFCILARPGNLLFNALQGVAGFFSGQTAYWIEYAVCPEWLTLLFDGHKGPMLQKKERQLKNLPLIAPGLPQNSLLNFGGGAWIGEAPMDLFNIVFPPLTDGAALRVSTGEQ
jgi:hypothetical protein